MFTKHKRNFYVERILVKKSRRTLQQRQRNIVLGSVVLKHKNLITLSPATFVPLRVTRLQWASLNDYVGLAPGPLRGAVRLRPLVCLT
jgi:hypothetical protein